MADHTDLRIEKSGVVVAYLAPNAQTIPVTRNDLATYTPSKKAAIARDHRRILHEIQVHGEFWPSNELPNAHKTALESLFGGGPVTAQKQLNRIVHYVNKVGGPFQLYDQDDQYTATSNAGVDYTNGIYPVVQIAEVRGDHRAGLKRRAYFVKLVVGLEDGS